MREGGCGRISSGQKCSRSIPTRRWTVCGGVAIVCSSRCTRGATQRSVTSVSFVGDAQESSVLGAVCCTRECTREQCATWTGGGRGTRCECTVLSTLSCTADRVARATRRTLHCASSRCFRPLHVAAELRLATAHTCAATHVQRSCGRCQCPTLTTPLTHPHNRRGWQSQHVARLHGWVGELSDEQIHRCSSQRTACTGHDRSLAARPSKIQ